LKVLWINENPLDELKLKELIENNYKNIQILNSEFTENVEDFGFKFVSLNMDVEATLKKPND